MVEAKAPSRRFVRQFVSPKERIGNPIHHERELRPVQVRAGKYLEIHLEADDAEGAERQIDDMCRKLLANPVIEDYRIEIEEEAATRDAV